MAYNTPAYNRYPSGHTNPNINAVSMVINDWFDAMEAGEAVARFPDPNYPKQWTEDRIDELILAIDKEYNHEAFGWAKDAYKVVAGPDFFRLEPLQRLAFIQDLHRIVEEHRTELELLVNEQEHAADLWSNPPPPYDFETLYDYGVSSTWE